MRSSLDDALDRYTDEVSSLIAKKWTNSLFVAFFIGNLTGSLITVSVLHSWLHVF